MNLGEKVLKSNFIIKLKSWEYWPFGIIQFPLFFYWMLLSARARSLTFFSASNPGIPLGGMFGESKYDILRKIPSHVVPTSLLVSLPATKEEVIKKMKEAGLTLPVVFKPDLGERGWMVKHIHSEEEIDSYLQQIRADFIIQKLIDFPLEFGIFYRRYPSENTGKVISIVAKEMLSVTGDGESTLKQLILKQDRAKLQWENLQVKFKKKLDVILPAGEKLELVSIGNHFRGTKFLDGSHLINDKLCAVFDNVSRHIEGFYFGRFDIRTASLDDLYKGNIMVLELNGCGAEPAHIYDPSFTIPKALKVLFKHWSDIYRISRENNLRGVRYLPLKEGIQLYRKFKSIVKNQ